MFSQYDASTFQLQSKNCVHHRSKLLTSDRMPSWSTSDGGATTCKTAPTMIPVNDLWLSCRTATDRLARYPTRCKPHACLSHPIALRRCTSAVWGVVVEQPSVTFRHQVSRTAQRQLPLHFLRHQTSRIAHHRHLVPTHLPDPIDCTPAARTRTLPYDTPPPLPVLSLLRSSPLLPASRSKPHAEHRALIDDITYFLRNHGCRTKEDKQHRAPPAAR
jgi:hypothetical protein